MTTATVCTYQLPNGQEFLYDAADADVVKRHRWHVVAGYVQAEIGNRRRGTRRHVRLHRLIARAPAGILVDHRNRNKLDNRRANLRVADKSTNGMNRGAQENNTSGFKGVSLHRKTGKWRAYITVHKKTRHLGLFDTPELAHTAYLQAANTLHGEFACA